MHILGREKLVFFFLAKRDRCYGLMDQGAFGAMKNMLFSDSMARAMFDALSQSCATVKVKSGIYIFLY